MPFEMISATALKALLGEADEYAFLDVREHGQYGEGHPFFCVSLPYSVIEQRAPLLVPRRDTLCILMDNGDGVAELAHGRMAAMGYTALVVLEGGAPAWASAGYTLFKGVNVLSKSFGELVEETCHTPSISAEDLLEMQRKGGPLVMLDGRPPHEFNKMSLPGARSCPNAELAYRLPELVRDETTPVVVNCAGRTRSIIGAQSLRNVGVRNPVYALRNGTQGWRLAGFDLQHGESPQPQPGLSDRSEALAGARAADLVARFGLKMISASELQKMRADAERTTYVFDVRTETEYREAHVAGAIHAPGGQLVQATDEYLATRNARIVLCDDLGLRAAGTAVWLAGMGHSVFILDVDSRKGTEAGMPSLPSAPSFRAISQAELLRAQASGARLYDASRGMEYRKAHVEGARWVTRARLYEDDVDSEPIVVLGRSEQLVGGVIERLAALGAGDVCGFIGGPDLWAEAGLAVVSTPYEPAEEACIDFLFFVHDRHNDNLEAARQYLTWELNLLKQLDAQERGALNPLMAMEAERM
ncbi:rhodanese-like domain-containing protein [Martelella soudanensis]|uniref:rhodanese-like domain-containing protein n=1 Tax=unclassified Martelella TaxID=2629616 RepID=UPI0015DD8DFA|nr:MULTISPECIES: rhodanese-like domain-containing protein [unclassified Martelella]